MSEVRFCFHISCVTPDRIWVNDGKSLILTDTNTGKALYCRRDARHPGSVGLHTVSSERELIYIDKHYIIKKISTERKTNITLEEKPDITWERQCVYCSPSNGDILVGMRRLVENAFTGMVARYHQYGVLMQILNRNNNGDAMYSNPSYITENNNGDIVVSDPRCGVVVTEYGGKHRFSYLGHSSQSLFLPCGLCTDALSHILVCDLITESVQMLDSDGQFLSFLLTKAQGIVKPFSLSYDVNNHILWVGSLKTKKKRKIESTTIYLYRYTKRYHELIGEQILRLSRPPRRDHITLEYNLYFSTKGDVLQRLPIHGPTPELIFIGNKIQREISSSFFIKDIFDETVAEKFVKDISYLSSQVMLMETYDNRPDQLGPGTVFGVEVEVVYEDSKLKVKEKDILKAKTFFHLRNYNAPKVILVRSKSISTIDAKLCVYRKYKDIINKQNTFIHHEYDDNYEVSKWIAYNKLSFFLNRIKRMTTNIKWDVSPRIVIKALNSILEKEKELRSNIYEKICKKFRIGVGIGRHGGYRKEALREETLEEIVAEIGSLIYKKLEEQIKIHSAPPTLIYAKIAGIAVTSNINKDIGRSVGYISSLCIAIQEPTMYDPINNKHWANKVIHDTFAQVLRKKNEIVTSIIYMLGEAAKDLQNVYNVLQECKGLCQPTHLQHLVKEWEKREILKGSDELKRLSSVLKYVLGRKGDQTYVKVFLQNDDENAKLFFDEKKNSLLKNILSDFVIVEKCSRLKWDRMKQLEKKERTAPKISEKERKKIHNLINDEREMIYAKFSTVVRIGVSNVNTKKSDKVPCIVLYCLDDNLIPFGENPLPSYIGEYPCDIREDVVLFGSCDNCPTVNSGCDIGGESFSGSAGFLVKYNNRPAKGFLTAAHAVVNNLDIYYTFSSENFENTIKPKGKIRHPSNSDKEVGLVDDCLFGNVCSNAFDVAVVCITSPTCESVEPVILPIAEEKTLSYSSKLKVIKKGKTTSITTGNLHPKSDDSIRLSFEKNSSSYYVFQHPYPVKDEYYDKPFFRLGDSGSGVFLMERSNHTLKPFGIAFGRSEFTTHVCQIEDVTGKFHLSIYQDTFVKDVLDHPTAYFKDDNDEVERDEETMETENCIYLPKPLLE